MLCVDLLILSRLSKNKAPRTERCTRIDLQLVNHRLKYVKPLIVFISWRPLIKCPQGFRSPPGPNAGTLDAEFEAFQAGFPLGPAVLEPQLFLQGPMTHPLAPNHGQQQIPKWASDFQNLQLNEPQTSQSQYHQHALLQHSNPTSWHHDYLSQSDTNLSHQGQQPQRPTGQKYSGRPYGYTGDLTLPHGNRLFSIAQQKQSEDQSEGVFDEAAFDRAFDAAGEELQDVTRQFPQNDSHINGQSHYTENREETVAMSGENDVWRSDEISSIIELLNRGMSWDGIGQQMGRSASSCRLYYERFLEYRARSHGQAWPDHSRIGSDRIAEEVWDRKQEHKEADDGEELARTAGRLLENVKGDQSQKFQKSNFLSLMRQFRDKEVRVEGDTLVGVSIIPSMSMGGRLKHFDLIPA